MNWPVLVTGLLGLTALVLLLHWQLNLTEGVYLGSRVVIWLYDRFAPRYDTTKQFNDRDEEWFLGDPLARALEGLTTSFVLDVATGTGRLPMALFRQPTFTGRIVALDLSRQMLRQAAAKTAPHSDRLTLLWQDATRLPFPDDVFDAATCLEALEFLPHARATLSEIVRVLRPGGLLLVTNRVGPSARWMPGRTMSRQDFSALLRSLSLTDVRANVWQVDYEMVWGRKALAEFPKPAKRYSASPRTLPALLQCPHCAGGPLMRQDRSFFCAACDSLYPIAEDGVVELAI